MLDLGRPPIKEEFDRYDELQEAIGSVYKARNLFQRKFGPEPLIKAFELRRGDLLVYMALSNFRRLVPFRHLPTSIRNDIKTFLGGYRQALEKSLKLLFSIGNSEKIAELCDQTPFGFLDEQALYIHSGLIKDLHPILRIYVGCAELLAGDLQNFDLIKLHKRSGKVSLMRYDNFEGNPLPVLVERVKVDLSRQKVDIFDHGSSQRQEVLFFKERYVAKDHVNRVLPFQAGDVVDSGRKRARSSRVYGG
jgi:DNA phosphorothioation-associated putative methyltransferase